MKFLIQRVKSASVSIEGKRKGSIEDGFVVLIGISNADTEETAARMLKKMLGLRIFEDENQKTNLSLADVQGSLMLISQFTLYADCKKGNRPSFVNSGKPEHAKKLYDYLVIEAKKSVPHVETGEFGAYMQVSLVNDGPFTVMLDSTELFAKP